MAFEIDYDTKENEQETPHPFISYHSRQAETKWTIDLSYPVQGVFNQTVDFMCEGLYDGSRSWMALTNEYCLSLYGNKTAIRCGSTLNPDLDKLLQLATPSKFGKGLETIYDESIRKGLEILPQQLIVEEISYQMREITRTFGFVSLEFSKMAIYQVGGHFDTHRDHVQSPDHQGTLLVEVRSQHTGGDLVLTHQGMEYRWSLSDPPPPTFHTGTVHSLGNTATLRYIAFFTDVMHRVEPVTSGVRIVLQYDIIVRDPHNKSRRVEDWAMYNTKYFPSPITNELTSKLFETLQRLITDDSQGVALPLLHLYTDSQLTPNRLKKKDMQLFSFLLEMGYCVQLTPILITEKDDCRDEGQKHREESFIPGYSVCEASVAEIVYILQEHELGEQDAEGETRTLTVKACPILDKPSRVTYLATGYEQVMFLDTIEHGYLGNQAATTESHYFCVAFLITTKKILTKKIFKNKKWC
jgi:hypothetical protein